MAWVSYVPVQQNTLTQMCPFIVGASVAGDFTLSPLKPILCAECYGIQHIKTGFSGERVKPTSRQRIFRRTCSDFNSRYLLLVVN